MSIVQAVFVKIIADIRNWKKLTEPQKLEVFTSAYYMFGRSFLEALTELEMNRK